MADRSVESEITAMLMHGLEQSDLFHKATVLGIDAVPAQDVLEFVNKMCANQGRAIRKLAAEIDQLRAGE